MEEEGWRTGEQGTNDEKSFSPVTEHPPQFCRSPVQYHVHQVAAFTHTEMTELLKWRSKKLFMMGQEAR